MEQYAEESSPLISETKRKSCCVPLVVTITVLCLALVLGLVLGLVVFTDEVRHSATGHYRQAAVASDSVPCSQVGGAVLRDDGSVVDAAVAVILCAGLHNAHSTGIGGGDIMLIYAAPRNGTEKELVVLDSREVAPLAATPYMLSNSTNTALHPALLTGVPGQLIGLHKAWQRFGRLPWSRLVEPAITMSEEGFPVSAILAKKMQNEKDVILERPSLREIMTHPDGTLLGEGDIMRRPKLARVLREVAMEGPRVLYNGSLTEDFVKDIQDHGGIIVAEDLQGYKAIWREPVTASLWNRPVTLAGVPPPFAGLVQQFIIQLMARYPSSGSMLESLEGSVLAYQRMVESMKFGKALQTYLGDPAFHDLSQGIANLTSSDFQDYIHSRIDDDQTHPVSYYMPLEEPRKESGTSHTSILGADGSAVAITSTVNSLFGAQVRGERTGIILNNEMDDFISIPPGAPLYGPNQVEPGKRPASSMSPTFLLDEDGHVIMIIGGSGGSKITTVTSLVVVLTSLFGIPLAEAVDQAHIHTKLLPLGEVSAEVGFPEDIIKALRQKGQLIVPTDELAIIQGITSECHKPEHQTYCITAVCDWRKLGAPDGY